jgi:DNA end-binding protein Ku
MAARAMWKAVVRSDGVAVPVRLYPAVRDHDIHFHLLHAADLVRVRERMVDPEDEHAVETDQLRSGYALESGEFVVLDAKERKALAPKPSRDIQVLQTVPLDALPLSAYARPYWLGPDGDAPAYLALAQRLEERKEQAVTEWVMRGKHHFGALEGRDGHLALIDLHSSDEWVDTAELGAPEGRALDPREVAMAEQLIMGLDAEFDHGAFRDEYRDRVLELIETKAKGGRLPRRSISRAKPATTSLSSALEASLRGLKKRESKSA